MCLLEVEKGVLKKKVLPAVTWGLRYWRELGRGWNGYFDEAQLHAPPKERGPTEMRRAAPRGAEVTPACHIKQRIQDIVYLYKTRKSWQ